MGAIEQTSGVVGIFPTSSAQTRFWYQEQTDPNPGAGNIAVRWEIRGRFHAENIEQAIRTVVDRHEILRTCFIEDNGFPRQKVMENGDFHLCVVDITGLSDQHSKDRVDDIATRQATKPFDLAADCLIRVALVRTAPDCASVLITAHHTVFDGVSIRVLGHEIGTIAAALEQGRPHDLPDLPLQYADYALWQEELRKSAAGQESADYWATNLLDAPYFELEPEFPKTDHLVRSGRRVDIPFPQGFDENLTATARAQNTSPFVLGAAVAACVLQRFTGKSDISFGTAIAGRNDVELEDLIGVFINPVVLRFHADRADTLADMVTQADNVVRCALAHGDYPFDDLVRDLKRPRDLNRSPLVSVFFALQRVFLEEQSYGPFAIASIPSDAPQITHDLNIQLIGRATGWSLMIDYDAARFSEQSITTLGQMIRDVFAALFANPAAAIDTSPVAALGKDDQIAATTPQSQKLPHRGRVLPLRIVDSSPSEVSVDHQPRLDQLAAIWSEVLGVPESECNGDFFDLGGHSLLVLRMLSRVQAEFGARVPLVQFLEQPTLQGVAAGIEQAIGKGSDTDAISNWEVITLRAGRPGAPVIISINQPFLYHNIARKFDDRYRVINLHISNERYFSLEDGAALPDIISDAARKIETEAAGRPVVLMGQCVDGLLGLSIAQALENSDVEILDIAMVDSWEPNANTHISTAKKRRRRLYGKIRRWGQYIRLKARREIGWTAFFSKSSAASKVLVALGQLDAPTSTELQELRINVHLMKLYVGHQFAPYNGEVLLFKTESHTQDAITRRFGWEKILSADTAIYMLRGWHEDTMLWHGFDKIADVIQCRLRRAERDQGPSIASNISAIKR